MTVISRRHLLLSLPGLALAPRVVPRLFAQAGAPPLRIRGINHIGLAVSDAKRSVDFYQKLFGMPVRGRQGSMTLLQMGAGPQFLAIAPVQGGVAPSITHYCLGVEGFSLDGSDRLGLQIVRTLITGELRGSIELRNRAGGGTEAVLVVPLGKR